MTDYTAFPIANVAIPSLPDLGGVTDSGMLVGERAGTGRFAATALRDYVMTTVTAYVTQTVTAGYLPLAGGTLSGDITAPHFIASGSGTLLGGTATTSFWMMDSDGWAWIYSRSGVSGGAMSYVRGIDQATLFEITAVGDIAALGNVQSGGDMYARGGRYFVGSDDGAGMSRDSGSTTIQLDPGGWGLNWNRSSGALAFTNNTGITLFVVEANGNGTFHGTVHGSNVTALEARINQLEARLAALEAVAA